MRAADPSLHRPQPSPARLRHELRSDQIALRLSAHRKGRQQGNVEFALHKLPQNGLRKVRENCDANFGIPLPKHGGELSRPRKTRSATSTDAQLACRSRSLFHQSVQFVAQAENARSVFIHNFAHGRGAVALGARGTVEDRSPEFCFELSDAKTHRRLRAMHAPGCFSYASFFHHSDEHLELHQFHECLRRIAPAAADALKNKRAVIPVWGITARVLLLTWSRPLSALGRRNSPKHYQDYGQNLDCYR